MVDEDSRKKVKSDAARTKRDTSKRAPTDGTGTTNRLSGGIVELEGHYYDCSSYKKADKFETATFEITEHVGRTYRMGGDVVFTINNQSLFTIPLPVDPVTKYSDKKYAEGNVTQTSKEQVTILEEKLFDKKLDSYVKREEQFLANVQKLYSLLLGQCADLMRNRLMASSNWNTISASQDSLSLLEEIRGVIFSIRETTLPNNGD